MVDIEVTVLKNTPAHCSPTLATPESTAGSPGSSALVFHHPDTALPRFAHPEACEP